MAGLGFNTSRCGWPAEPAHLDEYTGIDPETSVAWSASRCAGIDYFNNPQTRSFIFSLTLNR